jgi:nitrile hydratase accessory protein
VRREAARLEALPALPRDADGPVFAAPWEAQAFALAVSLSERGLFTWPEWAAALGEEIAGAGERGEGEGGYYRLWLRALERMVREKGVVDESALAGRAAAWRRAYLSTPHGRPVTLERE